MNLAEKIKRFSKFLAFSTPLLLDSVTITIFFRSVARDKKREKRTKEVSFHRNEYNHGKKPVKARVLPEVKLNSHHQSVMSNTFT